MKLARVVGNVVSTINAPLFEDRTLLVCDLIDPAGAPAGGYMIAVDTVGAGPGEIVLLIDEGSSARQILGLSRGPVRTLVVGIVDDVTVAPGEEAEAPAAAAGSTPRRRATRSTGGRRPSSGRRSREP
jgi:ethanolamine utilization protein EutN